jgi:hypothetical protein
MVATMAQTINLGFQIGIFVLVIVGYVLFRKKKFIWHAQLMTIGFAMMIMSFLLVMLPSLWMSYTSFLDPTTFVFDTASIVHIPVGILGMVLGVFLVIRWARNDYKLTNMKAKWLMRAASVTWAANVVLGATIYFTMSS